MQRHTAVIDPSAFTVPLYISFFIHGNLQYAEIPTAAIPALVDQSYRPACQVFVDHPWARAVFEFSGYTLEVLAAQYPDVIDQVRILMQRGQIELCGSTYANPILPLIPLDHARRQIEVYQDIYGDLFGDLDTAPVGFYPQEFALDPSLVPLLRETGYRWVPIFLNHYLDSVTGRMNTARDLPSWSIANLRREVFSDQMHPFRLLGAQASELVGILDNASLIDLLFEFSAGVVSADEVLAMLTALHARYSHLGPTFAFLGTSDMEFIGLEFKRIVPEWTWASPIRPSDLGEIVTRLRELPFIRFATARDYLEEFPPSGEPVYLKAGSDQPLLTAWTDDPDNARLNYLCQEAAERIRLAEGLMGLAARLGVTVEAAHPLVEQAWRAMLLAENSDGRGWQPIPERRLFCYDQVLRALDLAEQALREVRPQSRA